MAAAAFLISRGKSCVRRVMMPTFLSSTSRFFSSSCPFSILGISKNSSYVDVKKSFVELALKHHPDTAENKSKHTDETFNDIRQAFESIRDENGRAVLDSLSNDWTDESLDTWFYQETGQHLSFHMDSTTRREVAHVADTMSRGGLDTGGLWDMANTIAKRGSTGEDPLQVTCGRQDDAKNNSDSTGRRRRRRK